MGRLLTLILIMAKIRLKIKNTMKGDKIYLLIEVSSFSGEMFNKVYAYHNKKDAQNKMADLINDDKVRNPEWYDEENDNFVLKESEDTFLVYDDYNYDEKHFEMKIVEETIQ